MIAVSIIAFFGGIASFLFGITLMGDGLKKLPVTSWNCSSIN